VYKLYISLYTELKAYIIKCVLYRSTIVKYVLKSTVFLWDEASLILGQERAIGLQPWLHSGTVPVSGVKKNRLYNFRLVPTV
jgi:hypothetical protein